MFTASACSVPLTWSSTAWIAWRSGLRGMAIPIALQQPGHVLEAQDIRVRMDATHEGHIEPIQERGDRLVGLHHEHLDDRMRVAGVRRVGVGDPARFVEHQLRLGQVEVEHPVLRPPGLDPPGQGLHVPQQLDHRLLGPFRVALQDPVRLLVRQPGRGADDAVGDTAGT